MHGGVIKATLRLMWRQWDITDMLKRHLVSFSDECGLTLVVTALGRSKSTLGHLQAAPGI